MAKYFIKKVELPLFNCRLLLRNQDALIADWNTRGCKSYTYFDVRIIRGLLIRTGESVMKTRRVEHLREAQLLFLQWSLISKINMKIQRTNVARSARRAETTGKSRVSNQIQLLFTNQQIELLTHRVFPSELRLSVRIEPVCSSVHLKFNFLLVISAANILFSFKAFYKVTRITFSKRNTRLRKNF